jgi:hypothetical protein
VGCSGEEFAWGTQGWAGSGLDQAIAALPLLLEAGPDGVDFGPWHGGVGGLDEACGFDFGELKEIAIAGQVGDAEPGEAGLSGAGPRCWRSSSARAKPSWVVTMAARRCSASGEITAPVSRMQKDLAAPRPTRPRS